MSGTSKLTEEEYVALLKPMAKELSGMARWVAETNQRLVILFEGRDTAGKGGSIDMFARILNPRQCRIAALPSPSERERSQWYFQRYIPYLPAKGELTLFDRSWYNRAGVEPVMGYCTPEETDAFLRAVPEFERHLVDDIAAFAVSGGVARHARCARDQCDIRIGHHRVRRVAHDTRDRAERLERDVGRHRRCDVAHHRARRADERADLILRAHGECSGHRAEEDVALGSAAIPRAAGDV